MYVVKHSKEGETNGSKQEYHKPRKIAIPFMDT
jgi:hypothetical protein